MNKPIGIFDSGMGGLTVLAQAVTMLPNENFIYYGDSKHAPYGIKSKAEVIQLSMNICDYLIHEKQVKVIIVACNTATSAAINELRKKYNIPIIGMEPAIKPALEALTTKNIGVMATEMTLKERKFNTLVKKFDAEDKIYKIPCSTLVEVIEAGTIKGKVLQTTLNHCFQTIDLETIESIVLGCTHFLFAKKEMVKLLKRDIKLFDGNEGTIRYLKSVLATKGILKTEGTGSVIIMNSAGQETLEQSKTLYQHYLRDLNG